MPRSPTTHDTFAAIAEPRRRELVSAIAKGAGKCDVTWLVEELGWPQPQVSKHLGVLRQVGLVSVERRGRQRMYSLNGPQLRTVYDWIKAYEHFWTHQLDRIKQRAERAQRQAKNSSDHTPPPAP